MWWTKGYADIIIIGILSAVARTSGLKQTLWCVNSPLCCCPVSGLFASVLIFMTWQTWSAALRVAGNIALVCLTVRRGVEKQLHTLPFHPALCEWCSFSWRTLTSNKQTDSVTSCVTVCARLHWDVLSGEHCQLSDNNLSERRDVQWQWRLHSLLLSCWWVFLYLTRQQSVSVCSSVEDVLKFIDFFHIPPDSMWMKKCAYRSLAQCQSQIRSR